MKKICFFMLMLQLTACSNESKNQEAANSQPAKTDIAKNDKDAAATATVPGITKTNEAGKVDPDHPLVEEQMKPTDNTGTSTGTPNNNTNNDPAAKTASQGGPSDAAGSGQEKSSTTGTGSSLVGKGNDEIIFIGSFAQWRNRNGEQFDGSYDTTHNLFVICSTNNCQPVPRSQIMLREFGSCDVALADRIKIFKIESNGSINPNGNRIILQGNNNGMIKTGATSRIIKFDPITSTRINKAVIYNNRMLTHPPVSLPPKGQKEAILLNPDLQKNLNQSTIGQKGMVKPSAIIPQDKPLIKDEKKVILPAQLIQKPGASFQIQKNVAPSPVMVAETTPAVTVQPTAAPKPLATEPVQIKQQPVMQQPTADASKTMNKATPVQQNKMVKGTILKTIKQK